MNVDEYNEYLRSPQWQHIRSKVIRREKGLCQGCGNAGGMEVHHLTYRRIGRELLCDLVLLCHGCHEVAHDREPHRDINPEQPPPASEGGINDASEAEQDEYLRERERSAMVRMNLPLRKAGE